MSVKSPKDMSLDEFEVWFRGLSREDQQTYFIGVVALKRGFSLIKKFVKEGK